MTEQEQRDLAFHARCRDICKKHGWRLIGSTPGDGFSCYAIASGRVIDISQAAMDAIESLHDRIDSMHDEQRVRAMMGDSDA